MARCFLNPDLGDLQPVPTFPSFAVRQSHLRRTFRHFFEAEDSALATHGILLYWLLRRKSLVDLEKKTGLR